MLLKSRRVSGAARLIQERRHKKSPSLTSSHYRGWPPRSPHRTNCYRLYGNEFERWERNILYNYFTIPLRISAYTFTAVYSPSLIYRPVFLWYRSNELLFRLKIDIFMTGEILLGRKYRAIRSVNSNWIILFLRWSYCPLKSATRPARIFVWRSMRRVFTSEPKPI